jgi:metallopeptidase MepB
LGDLRQRLTAGGHKEIEALKAFKQEDLKDRNKGDNDDGNYYLWDNRFYDRMMLEKHFSLDQQLISEYFPLQTSIRGMLQIFEELFGLVFVEIAGEERNKVAESGNGNDIVWHEEVQVFSVWNDEGEGSGFVGYLYLDLHPREGKYGHAANFNLQPVSGARICQTGIQGPSNRFRALSINLATDATRRQHWYATSPSPPQRSRVCSNMTKS